MFAPPPACSHFAGVSAQQRGRSGRGAAAAGRQPNQDQRAAPHAPERRRAERDAALRPALSRGGRCAAVAPRAWCCGHRQALAVVTRPFSMSASVAFVCRGLSTAAPAGSAVPWRRPRWRAADPPLLAARPPAPPAVRNLVEQAQFAHLCTIMCNMHHRRAGYPFGSLVDFAADGAGHPIFRCGAQSCRAAAVHGAAEASHLAVVAHSAASCCAHLATCAASWFQAASPLATACGHCLASTRAQR